MMNENTSQLNATLPSLQSASVAEIEELISQHPYCQNLHYLFLAKKIREEPEADHNSILAKVATYATNREHLFHMVQDLANPKVETTEQSPEAPAEEETIDSILDEESFSDDFLDELSHSTYFEESVSDTTDLDRPFAGPNQLMPEDSAANGQSILEKILESAAPAEETSPNLFPIQNQRQKRNRKMPYCLSNSEKTRCHS